MDLKIKPVKTKKSKIKVGDLQENHVIPKHPFRLILNGRSGSGKTVLLVNLLSRDIFYKHFFDAQFLFSGAPDDSYDDIEFDKIYDEPAKWGEQIRAILTKQSSDIKKDGVHKAAKILLVLEDVQNYQKFLKSPEVTRLFIAGRHSNISLCITSQSYTKTPRVSRINATDIMLFPGTQKEIDNLIEEYSHPRLSKRRMRDLVNFAHKGKFNFLYINNSVPWDERFRKNLDSVINIGEE